MVASWRRLSAFAVHFCTIQEGARWKLDIVVAEVVDDVGDAVIRNGTRAIVWDYPDQSGMAGCINANAAESAWVDDRIRTIFLCDQ